MDLGGRKPSLRVAAASFAAIAGAAISLSSRWWFASSGSPNAPIAALPPVHVVLALHESVTSDRFIHYVLRPAAALGVSEVVWIGGRKAKGQLRGSTPYGRSMRAEEGVPLTNLSHPQQLKRHLRERYGEFVSVHRLRVAYSGGICPDAVPLTSDRLPPAAAALVRTAALQEMRHSPVVVVLCFDDRPIEQHSDLQDEVVELRPRNCSDIMLPPASLPLSTAVAVATHALASALGFQEGTAVCASSPTDLARDDEADDDGGGEGTARKSAKGPEKYAARRGRRTAPLTATEQRAAASPRAVVVGGGIGGDDADAIGGVGALFDD